MTVNVVPGTVGHMSAAPTPATTLPVENRRDRRTARTRQAILDAARELIDEQGYAGTTIDQIAERADVAPRTFFRHFASKEALLLANFEEHRRQMIELVKGRPVGEHPLQAALNGLAAFCDLVETDREQFTWAFHVMAEQELQYEQAVMKAETSARIAEHLAERLGVDPATDARPQAWAMIALTLFGNAMRGAFGGCGTGHPRGCFEALVVETDQAFRAATGDSPAT